MRYLLIVLVFATSLLVVNAQPLNQLPQQVIVDGSQVPQSALLLDSNTILISCDWLNKNAPSLNCESDSSADANFYAYISENAVPIAGKDASGCCANWQRYLSFGHRRLEYGRFNTFPTARIPLFEIGIVENFSTGISVPKGNASLNSKLIFKNQDAFVPLYEIAQRMEMTWQLSDTTLEVGTTSGFKRTFESLETGDVWAARNASAHMKLEGPKRVLEKDTNDDNLPDDQILIWQRGQVKHLVLIERSFLEYWELRDKTWTIPYQARLKTVPTWLCSPNQTKWRNLWNAIGGVVKELGQRPKLIGDFSKHAACNLNTKNYNQTQFFSSFQENGLDAPKLWLALSIYDTQSGAFAYNDPQVISLKTRLITKDIVPTNYGFMQEKRLAKR
jgi:hypothetical protein